MGGRISGDDDLMADINITPFVDIILVVLIIFMVTATRIVQSSVKVDLPDAATSEATEDISLGVMLTEDGKLYLDGEAITAVTLEAELKKAKATGKPVVVLISADELVAHGRVIWLMDLVKSQGIGKFAMSTDRSKILPPDPAVLGKGKGVP